MAYSTSDLRKGLKIEIDGQPHVITEFEFTKPGKGRAVYRTRLKNIISGATFEKVYREVDKIDECNLQSRDLNFSYKEGDDFVFIDQDSYDQVSIRADLLDDKKYWLEEDMHCQVLFHNEKPIDVTLPIFVEQEIAETEPGARGDTVQNVFKPATTHKGYEIQVPMFVNIGDRIRIDTRTGEYSDRVSKK